MEFTRKYFNPAKAEAAIVEDDGSVTCGSGDAPGDVYVYAPRIVLAVNLALSTDRPLLVSGEPGSGKTTMAANVSHVLGRWFIKETITSRTSAADLLWRFDTLRRLNDAQAPRQKLLDRQYYVEPGPLWWAFDPVSAEHRGGRQRLEAQHRARNPGRPGPSPDAVVLLDEIDKADPDVPNDLLEPFDAGSFTVRDTNDGIRKTRNVLLIVTTNGERELPPAFLRRCVTLALDAPSEDWLVKVGERRRWTPAAPGGDLLRQVATEVMRWRRRAQTAGLRAPGTAEYLDAVRSCLDLGIAVAGDAWQSMALGVLWKNDKEPPPAEAG